MYFLFLNWDDLYIQQVLFINANGMPMKVLFFYLTRMPRRIVHPLVLPPQLPHFDQIGPVSEEGAMGRSLQRPVAWWPVKLSALGDHVDSENFHKMSEQIYTL